MYEHRMTPEGDIFVKTEADPVEEEKKEEVKEEVKEEEKKEEEKKEEEKKDAAPTPHWYRKHSWTPHQSDMSNPGGYVDSIKDTHKDYIHPVEEEKKEAAKEEEKTAEALSQMGHKHKHRHHHNHHHPGETNSYIKPYIVRDHAWTFDQHDQTHQTNYQAETTAKYAGYPHPQSIAQEMEYTKQEPFGFADAKDPTTFAEDYDGEDGTEDKPDLEDGYSDKHEIDDEPRAHQHVSQVAAEPQEDCEQKANRLLASALTSDEMQNA